MCSQSEPKGCACSDTGTLLFLEHGALLVLLLQRGRQGGDLRLLIRRLSTEGVNLRGGGEKEEREGEGEVCRWRRREGEGEVCRWRRREGEGEMWNMGGCMDGMEEGMCI